MKLSELPEDIIHNILPLLDMFSLSKLQQTGHFFNKLGKSNKLWECHFNSVPHKKTLKKTLNSKHTGGCSWYRCRNGPWPGYQNIHLTINDPEQIAKCGNLTHWTNLAPPKRINYTDFKWQTSKRYRMYLKKKYPQYGTDDILIKHYEKIIEENKMQTEKFQETLQEIHFRIAASKQVKNQFESLEETIQQKKMLRNSKKQKFN